MKHAVTQLPAAGAGQLDLAGGWNKLWGKISGQFGRLVDFLTMAGVAIIVYAVGKYMWDRRRGGAQAGPTIWMILCGGLLAGPALIVPNILKLIDQAVRFFNSLLGG